MSEIKYKLSPNYVWEFQKTLRKLEYYSNCTNINPFSRFIKLLVALKFKRLSIKLGFSIPINVFGPGLSIAHYGTIIVSGGAKIGSNCRLHSCVNIGTEAGYANKAPTIGDNCYIAPGVKIYGDIVLANNIAIGANAVVNKSFLDEGVAIAGVPAKTISKINTQELLIPATKIVDLGLNKTDFTGIPAKELSVIIDRLRNKAQ